MDSIVSVSRIAGASQKRLVASMLGDFPEPDDDATTKTSSEGADIFREERQEINKDAADFEYDAAGVGSVIVKKVEPDPVLGQRNPKEDNSLRRLLLGPQKKGKPSGNSTSSVLGKRGRPEQNSRTLKAAEAESSSEEEGRAGLGVVKVKQKKQKLPAKVETFESLQKEDDVDQDLVKVEEEVQDAPEAPIAKQIKAKPKSYLDEILEAKKSRSSKKKKKKVKKIDA